MERREAVTIRFPTTLLTKVRDLRAEQESFNDIVVEAVDREVRRRQGLQAFAAIRRIREQVKSRTGPQPDSVPLIRDLRAGAGRRG
jgi:hypothetical protein